MFLLEMKLDSGAVWFKKGRGMRGFMLGLGVAATRPHAAGSRAWLNVL